MKLDVTLCHSILKQYFAADYNPITGSRTARDFANEIEKNRIVLNDDLLLWYEIEFENDELLFQCFQDWFSKISTEPPEEKLLLPSGLSDVQINSLFPNSEYFQILVNVANNSYDKIIFSDLLTPFQLQLENLGIIPMNKNKILDRTDINFYYNAYHFHYNRQVQTGENNSDLCNWFSRILKDENDIIFLDAYLFQNISKFKTYILPHIVHGANLTFYTYLGNIGSGRSIRQLNYSDFQTEFSNSVYSPYNIVNVFEVKIKKYIHERWLLTNKYYIQLGKGLATFGNSSTTEESSIHADYRSLWNGTLPLPVNTII